MDRQDPALPPSTLRSSYVTWCDEKVRFGDTDALGHVNNAAFATIFETGRVALIYDEELRLTGADELLLLVHVAIDYRAELHFPGIVNIGSRIIAVGNSSFRFGQGAFKKDTCVATCEAVLVLIDATTRKPKPLTSRIRHWLDTMVASRP